MSLTRKSFTVQNKITRKKITLKGFCQELYFPVSIEFVAFGLHQRRVDKRCWRHSRFQLETNSFLPQIKLLAFFNLIIIYIYGCWWWAIKISQTFFLIKEEVLTLEKWFSRTLWMHLFVCNNLFTFSNFLSLSLSLNSHKPWPPFLSILFYLYPFLRNPKPKHPDLYCPTKYFADIKTFNNVWMCQDHRNV